MFKAPSTRYRTDRSLIEDHVVEGRERIYGHGNSTTSG
jgi:hypothetical protein